MPPTSTRMARKMAAYQRTPARTTPGNLQINLLVEFRLPRSGWNQVQAHSSAQGTKTAGPMSAQAIALNGAVVEMATATSNAIPRSEIARSVHLLGWKRTETCVARTGVMAGP